MIERRPSRRHPLDAGFLTTRLGRIQRIGQVRSEVDVYNLRYANSVEDRVRELLSARQENIFRLFGQLPDTLEDVWVEVALGRIEEAKRTIDAVPERHPFPPRYHEVRRVDWESCARVLANDAKTQGACPRVGRALIPVPGGEMVPVQGLEPRT